MHGGKDRKRDTKAEGATGEKWGQEDAATVPGGWSRKGREKSETLILHLEKLRLRICNLIMLTQVINPWPHAPGSPFPNSPSLSPKSEGMSYVSAVRGRGHMA